MPKRATSSFASVICCLRSPSSTARQSWDTIQLDWSYFWNWEQILVTMPELTVDMDGVLCRPAIWLNLVISRDIRKAPDLSTRRGRSNDSLPLRILDSRPGQALR